MTDQLRHAWNDTTPSTYGPAMQLAECRRCPVKRRTSLTPGGGIPLVEYFVSGVGWTTTRPDCQPVPGEGQQLSLLGGPPPAQKTEPKPTHAIAHRCAAFECKEALRPRYLMCRKHWFMLPRWLRDPILTHYKPGQENGNPPPTPAYQDALHKAVVALAEMEGRRVEVVFMRSLGRP